MYDTEYFMFPPRVKVLLKDSAKDFLRNYSRYDTKLPERLNQLFDQRACQPVRSFGCCCQAF